MYVERIAGYVGVFAEGRLGVEIAMLVVSWATGLIVYFEKNTTLLYKLYTYILRC